MSRMDDGYQTLVSFASDPTVLFYEKTVRLLPRRALPVAVRRTPPPC